MRQIPRHNQPVIPNERPPRRTNPLLSIRSQRELCRARMPAIEGPFRLAMSNHKNPWCSHCRTLEYPRLSLSLCQAPLVSILIP